ncbi:MULTISPECIES: hypothetical protein [Thermoanaerobacterium]|uniref:Response regulator receiver protein n=2 Tax=Thermoanaerobacterium TaxID=28895 RepID=W9E9Y3_9THEO|nr:MULTISPECIES: hypothetical protein [Thermoanaerobacterium]AFK85893.1 hypothetical protein Tsac_0877 [Thermoanaerobacterium saccharolyticum JW/SL-YS485]ETO38767.1 hypothetical protein V518_1189 [Thermoanaerobacterium aotearoense SCUT27]
MLISLIAEGDIVEKIKESIGQIGELVFEHVGKLEGEKIKDVFYSASRVPSDVLIVDLKALDEKEAVSILQSFRISRPNTRIVIVVRDRKPGDILVSSTVSLGIYDIAAGDKDTDWGEVVKKILISPPATYTQAARWHTGTLNILNEAEEKRKKPLEIEKAKKQIEGIVKFLGENYRCYDLNEGIIKIEKLLLDEVLD